MKDKEFSYVIGKYWNNKAICPFSYGSTVFYGTLKDAQEMKKFMSERFKEKLKIFILSEFKQFPKKT
jgi:hypothetical protein